MEIKMRIKILFVLLFFILFSGCSVNEAELNEKDVFRVNSLYEHSIMMVELSSENTLKELSLNGSNLKRDLTLSTEDKIKLIEKAYNMNLEGKRLDEKINLLESRMDEMMKNWE
ncbi:MAG: hypothetical protein KC550_00545 [Nanoarchaeota archaeon]|nr:hypothetical protein [Nanoarchaeota archaeon]